MVSDGVIGRSRKRRRSFYVVVLAAATATVLALPTHAAHAATDGSKVTESKPVPSSTPLGGVCESEFDPNGKLWVEQYISSQVAKYDTETGSFAQHNTPMPLSVPGGMEMGPDNRMWMPEVTGNALVGIDVDTGDMKEVPLPWAHAFTAKPPRDVPTVGGLPIASTLPDLHVGLAMSNDVAQGPDGAMYFTLGGLNAIGRYDTETGEFSKYTVPGEILGQAQALLGIIKRGPGRTLVMDVPQMNKVVTLNVDTKKFKQYTMPTPASLPVGVRAGSDGNIWVTEALAMKIARINPDTGKIKEYPLGSLQRVSGSLLGDLQEGSLGNPLPFLGPITEGPDGNMYFAVSLPLALGLGNKVGRLDPDTGKVKMWRTPTAVSSPCDLNVSPDGKYLYWGELAANKVGRLKIG